MRYSFRLPTSTMFSTKTRTFAAGLFVALLLGQIVFLLFSSAPSQPTSSSSVSTSSSSSSQPIQQSIKPSNDDIESRKPSKTVQKCPKCPTCPSASSPASSNPSSSCPVVSCPPPSSSSPSPSPSSSTSARDNALWVNTESTRTPHEQACYDDFGLGLVDRWRSGLKEVCTSSDDSHTKIDLFSVQQSRHSSPDSIIRARNLVVDFNKMTLNERYPSFSAGALSGVCERQPSFEVTTRNFQMWLHNYFLSFEAHKTQSEAPKCTAYVDHPVLFVSRDGERNWYHSSEDFINAYVTYLVVDKAGYDDTQVLFLENDPVGPYLGLWQKAFSSPKYPVLRKLHFVPVDGKPKKQSSLPAEPLVTSSQDEWLKYQDQLRNQFQSNIPDYNGVVCFKEVIFPYVGPASQIVKDIGSNNPCRSAPLLQGYARHVMSKLDVLDQELRSDKPKVTIISRRPGTANGRIIGNEAEMVKMLEEKSIDVKSVDFASISFNEQMSIIRQTNILIGVHGAGMQWTAFLPQEAVVIEIHSGGTTANRHFRNLAHYFDHPYMVLMADGGDTMQVSREEFSSVMNAAVRIVRNHHTGFAHNGL